MTAECTRTKLRFQGLDGRDVVGRFGGGVQREGQSTHPQPRPASSNVGWFGGASSLPLFPWPRFQFQSPSLSPTPPGSSFLPPGLSWDFSPRPWTPFPPLRDMTAEANRATVWWPTHKAPNGGFWARSGASLSMEMVGSGWRL